VFTDTSAEKWDSAKIIQREDGMYCESSLKDFKMC